MSYIKKLGKLYDRAMTAKGKKGRKARRKWLLIECVSMILFSCGDDRSGEILQDLIELIL